MKNLVMFICLVSLCACATLRPRQAPAEARAYKRPDFFAAGQTQAAFKLEAGRKDDLLTGVLRIKKLDEDNFDVLVLAEGAYKVLQAVVTPQGVAYQFLTKPADNSAVRSRLDAFLQLFLYPSKEYRGYKEKDGVVTVTYGAPEGKLRYFYRAGNPLPYQMTYDKFLGSATFTFGEYTPFNAAGDELPYLISYEDGSLEAQMTLISLRGGERKIDQP